MKRFYGFVYSGEPDKCDGDCDKCSELQNRICDND